MSLFAATVIVLWAGRFAEALVGSGAELGVSELLLTPHRNDPSPMIPAR